MAIPSKHKWLHIPNALLPQDRDLERDAADRIAVITCELLSKYPETQMRPGEVLAQILVFIAIERFYGTYGIIRPIGAFVDTNLHMFPKDCGDKLSSTLQDIDLDIDIPTIPLTNFPAVRYWKVCAEFQFNVTSRDKATQQSHCSCPFRAVHDVRRHR
jgi:hypothetical protein